MAEDMRVNTTRIKSMVKGLTYIQMAVATKANGKMALKMGSDI